MLCGFRMDGAKFPTSITTNSDVYVGSDDDSHKTSADEDIHSTIVAENRPIIQILSDKVVLAS